MRRVHVIVVSFMRFSMSDLILYFDTRSVNSWMFDATDSTCYIFSSKVKSPPQCMPHRVYLDPCDTLWQLWR